MEELQITPAQTEFVKKRLNKVAFFASMTQDQIGQFLPFFKMQGFATGETVVSRGDPGDCFYIIYSGGVEIQLPRGFLGSETGVSKLNAGDYFGEIALINHEPRTATVVVIEPTELIVLASMDFDLILERHPVIASNVAAVAAKRNLIR